MKKILTILPFILCLLGTVSAQIEFSPDTTIRPSKSNTYRLAVTTGGAIRIVPKTGNSILLASGTITSINGKTTSTVVLTTSDIAEGSNLYYNSTRVQTVGDARYPQVGLTYSDPSWITGLNFSKITSKPTTLSGYGITDGVSTGGTYANPAWITSLAFTKLSGLPTTLAGYTIADGVSTGTSYSNPTWLTSLAWSKISSTPTTIVGYGITDAASTANVIQSQTVNTYSSAVALSVSGARLLIVTSDEQYNESNSLYFKFNTTLYKLVRNLE